MFEKQKVFNKRDSCVLKRKNLKWFFFLLKNFFFSPQSYHVRFGKLQLQEDFKYLPRRPWYT